MFDVAQTYLIPPIWHTSHLEFSRQTRPGRLQYCLCRQPVGPLFFLSASHNCDTATNRRKPETSHFFFLIIFSFEAYWSKMSWGSTGGEKKKKKKSAESAHACVQQRVPCEFPRNECGNCKFARKAAIWEDSVLRQLSTRGRDGTCGSCDMTSTYLESCFLIKHQEKLAGKHILYSLFSLHQRKNVTKSKNNHSHTPACLRPNNGWLCFFKKEKKKTLEPETHYFSRAGANSHKMEILSITVNSSWKKTHSVEPPDVLQTRRFLETHWLIVKEHRSRCHFDTVNILLGQPHFVRSYKWLTSHGWKKHRFN